MRADQSNVHSTKQKIVDMTTDSSNNIKNPVLANAFYIKTVELTKKLHTDQTGRFPVTSRKGNKYLLIAYDWDSNAILAYPLKSKSATKHLCTIKTLQQFLNKKGIHPKLHIIDNEYSQLVKEYIKDE